MRPALALFLSLSLAGCAPTEQTSPRQIPEAWAPARPIVHTPMSQQEALAQRASQLAVTAQQGKVDAPPDVGLVRWTTMDDYAPTVAACLREAGYHAVAYSGTGIDYPDGIPPEQQRAFNMADYVCNAKYTLHPKYLQPFTSEQFGLIYDYRVEWLAPCLEVRGHTVSEPPTRETFLAGVTTGQDWDPLAEALQNLPADDGNRLQAECPRMPPSQYLWG